MLGMMRVAPPVQAGLVAHYKADGAFDATGFGGEGKWFNEVQPRWWFWGSAAGVGYTTPTKTANAQNHKPGLTFNGTTMAMAVQPNGSPPNATPLFGNVNGDLFVVLKSLKAAAASNRGPFLFGGSTNGNYWPFSDDHMYIYDGFQNATVFSDMGAHGPMTRAPAVFELSADVAGTTTKTYLNGTLVTTDAASAPGDWAAALGFFTLGKDTGAYGNIEVYEILLFDRVLTATERTAVYGYLNTRWNITPENIPISTAGLVALWHSQSGVNMTALAITSWDSVLGGKTWTAAGAPTLASNVANGKPAVAFAGAASMSTPAFFAAETTATRVVVLKNTKGAGLSNPGWASIGFNGISVTVLPFSDGKIYDDFGHSTRPGSSALVAPDTIAVLVETVSSNTLKIYWNGTIVLDDTSGTSPAWYPTFYQSVSGGFNWTGDILFDAWFSRVLTAPELSTLYSYLNNFYGTVAV
jgi:hypothetical protein